MKPEYPVHPQLKVSKHSPNQQDRIEWQLNQIRANTAVVAVFLIIGFVAGLILAAAGSG